MQERIKKGLLVFAFTILLLPLLQQQLQLVDSGPLYGYYTNAEDVAFSWQKWFDGSYQAGKNNFVNDHTGFRPDLLRLNGQINFSLFQKLSYGSIALGNNGYLFYTDYIEAYCGRDFAGYQLPLQKMTKLRRVQDTLAKLGKTFILVYAPCKAWYYAENIPYNMKYPKGTDNNYKTAVRIGDSLGVNQIDFNSWFLSLKKTTKEPLYARQGIHWTNYGSILAGDSLIRYIESKRGINMLHPQWTKAEHTTKARLPDNDMANTLNLIFPITVDTFCYPELTYKTDTAGITKPKAIYIGDSYTINLLKTGIIQHVNSDWQFWFSFRNILNATTWNMDGHYPQIADYDWKNAISNTDCVVLIYTPKNATLIGNDFIDQAYQYFYPQ